MSWCTRCVCGRLRSSLVMCLMVCCVICGPDATVCCPGKWPWSGRTPRAHSGIPMAHICDAKIMELCSSQAGTLLYRSSHRSTAPVAPSFDGHGDHKKASSLYGHRDHRKWVCWSRLPGGILVLFSPLRAVLIASPSMQLVGYWPQQDPATEQQQNTACRASNHVHRLAHVSGLPRRNQQAAMSARGLQGARTSFATLAATRPRKIDPFWPTLCYQTLLIAVLAAGEAGQPQSSHKTGVLQGCSFSPLQQHSRPQGSQGTALEVQAIADW